MDDALTLTALLKHSSLRDPFSESTTNQQSLIVNFTSMVRTNGWGVSRFPI